MLKTADTVGVSRGGRILGCLRQKQSVVPSTNLTPTWLFFQKKKKKKGGGGGWGGVELGREEMLIVPIVVFIWSYQKTSPWSNYTSKSFELFSGVVFGIHMLVCSKAHPKILHKCISFQPITTTTTTTTKFCASSLRVVRFHFEQMTSTPHFLFLLF